MSAEFSFTIKQPGTSPTPLDLPLGSFLIGRGEGCSIRLRHPEVSERHARLVLTRDHGTIEDLGSANGTWTQGRRIEAPIPLSAGQEIGIGPYLLVVHRVPAGAAHVPPPIPPAQASEPPSPPPTPAAQATPQTAAPAAAKSPFRAPPTDPKVAIRREIKNQIHRELVQRLDLKRLTAARVNAAELQQRARETLDAVIDDVRDKLPHGIDPDQLAIDIFNEALRLGPLEDLLADESVTEIMINGPHQVYVERHGKLELTDQSFMDDASVQAIIERIVSPIGRRIDESQPYVDARLPDGSRVNAIIPPLSLIGPCVTIRKFSRVPLTEADLIRFGTWTAEMANFLSICVQMRKNIIVSGGTGSGKTTLLNVLSDYIPDGERIVTIEDAAELRLGQTHLVRLEARPPNIEGRGAIIIRDLVRNALRMRPDRIIVGECRGGEALDMLQAMNTGHDGSLTTVHANSPRDVISRLETMVMMSGMDLPSRAIREQISSAIDMIVHEARFSDGTRRITHVTEVLGLEGTQTVMQDIFEFVQTGVDADGRILGALRPTGAVPTFFEQLKARGLELDVTMFQPKPMEGAAR
jgi:pilus assembly protein CpaF